MIQTITKLYGRVIRVANSLQSAFLLFVRLYWGWQFAQTGWGKPGNIQRVITFFGSLSIPWSALNAWFVSGLEFAGGTLLVLGSRLIALLLAIDMIVAYIAADREALLQVFSDPDKLYRAAPYTFLVVSLIILIFGPGKFSLDAIITKQHSAPRA